METIQIVESQISVNWQMWDIHTQDIIQPKSEVRHGTWYMVQHGWTLQPTKKADAKDHKIYLKFPE